MVIVQNHMSSPIKVNFLCSELRIGQADIALIRSLEALPEARYRGQLFVQEIPKPPVVTHLPIFSMYHAVNLRNDTDTTFWFANDWRTIPTLRYLNLMGVCCHKYVWVNAPAYLYPHERQQFLHILRAYRSEFTVIAGSTQYQSDLSRLGCAVEPSIISDYCPNRMASFIEQKLLVN